MKQTVVIPKYPRQVRLNQKVRKRYYELRQGGFRVTDRFGKESYPPKIYFKDKTQHELKVDNVADEYSIGVFSKDVRFVHHYNKFGIQNGTPLLMMAGETTPIIANEKQSKEANIITIRGGDLMTDKGSEHLRDKIFEQIKNSMMPFLEGLSPMGKSDYPIRISLELHDTIKNHLDKTNTERPYPANTWDLNNRCYPYCKAFCDLLIDLKIIANDDILHITQHPEAIFFPIENTEDRKLVFILATDERDCIKNNEIYKQMFNYEI